MKFNKILITALLFTALNMVSFASAENQLLKYIPKKSSIILDLDATKLFKIKGIQDVLNDNSQQEFVDFKSELAKHNLKVADLADNVLLFVEMNKQAGTPNIGVVAKTSVKEDIAKKIIQAECLKNNAGFATKKINGKTVYTVKGDVTKNLQSSGMMAMAPAMDDDVSVVYLEKDVVLLTSQAFVGSYLNLIQKGMLGKGNVSTLINNNKNINQKSVLWGCINLAEVNPAGPPQPGKPVSPVQNIDSGVFSLDFTGAKQEDISFDLDLKCKDANSSQLLAMQLQMMTGMLTMQMNDNPALAAELTKSLKVAPQGKSIKVNVNLKKATMDKLKDYTEKKKMKKDAMSSGAGVPAPPK